MLNKKNIGRACEVSLATIYATLIAETIYDICPGMHVWLVWLIFICLFMGLYCAGFWHSLIARPSSIGNSRLAARNSAEERRSFTTGWIH
jgi:hypothetical protein